MIVAIDYGTRRIGVAKTDPDEKWAFGHCVIEGRDLVFKLEEELNRLNPDLIVMGLPKNMDGSEGEMAAAVRELAKRLESQGFKVVLWDERLTSVMVHRFDTRTLRKAMRDKGEIDLRSAVLILDEYLRMRRNYNGSQP